MLIIEGSSAISEFRKEKTLAQIQKMYPACRDVETQFVYFVDTSAVLTEADREKIDSLLGVSANGPGAINGGTQSDVSRIVIPRIGTISPWATKATDIFHHCGLESVNRVERGVCWNFIVAPEVNRELGDLDNILAGIVFDPMTESLLHEHIEAKMLFRKEEPAPLNCIDLLAGGASALSDANREFGFALSSEEQEYLLEQYARLGRNPTDVELMMFAQVNSEHCRHKIFNADWVVDGESREASLFSMIRNTHQKSPDGVLSAYSDNAAVVQGTEAERFAPNNGSHVYGYTAEPAHITIKVETHNHPTAISPFPGASTGSGGEIRDEGATGRGGKPKAGLVGYSVSHLRIPDLPMPWENQESKPERIASPLQIMTEAPIGAAAFNNEFGRPNICGYFRNFEHVVGAGRFGYHKPIMLAGGVGNIRPQHVKKQSIPDRTPIVVLGGPTMLIGLGGGAASSVASGSSSESLDFASVQRGNPEMQRRCQEVIDTCCAMGEDNPILSIHDVGAGGICNALPELVHDSDCGGKFELRNVLNDEPGMSPMQIWCNESQERYVLAIKQHRMEEFEKICARERCLYSKVGIATELQKLVLEDAVFEGKDYPKPIDLSMGVLFGLPPKMKRQVDSLETAFSPHDFHGITIGEAVERVFGFPTVADKTFLVTIGDRSVTGLIARDQMVGPWQVPVADVGVTVSGYRQHCGEAMAIGERTPLAILNAPASGRMAISEAVTNIMAADIGKLENIKLSANWMVAAGEAGHDADLYDTVQAIAMSFCPELGISIPVGKDSMSMKTVWTDGNGKSEKVVAPLSLVVSAFSAVADVRRTLTPQLTNLDEETDLWLIDLGEGKNRMGASVLAQVTQQLGNQGPDVENPERLKQLFALVQDLRHAELILAYHDRSDGGLMTTLCEMVFAGRCGVSIDLTDLGSDCLGSMFCEEVGVVIQARRSDRKTVEKFCARHSLNHCSHIVGSPEASNRIVVVHDGNAVFDRTRSECHAIWSKTTWQMQRMRDNPICADQEYQRIQDTDDPGLFCKLTFDHDEVRSNEIYQSVHLSKKSRPRIAILREQGVNGQLEMAAAFHAVGFEAVDVTNSDLASGNSLDSFSGIAACGGFSFGDVLGAGEGWGKSILYNARIKDTFEAFFSRSDTFALGVCNGCQMMSSIKSLIPGAENWPKFLRNKSEQYEARQIMVEITQGNSILFEGMSGSQFPVVVAHGEGRAVFESNNDRLRLEENGLLAVKFIDNKGETAEKYPFNPNGSVSGYTGFTNSDGRFSIMMPHPERVFRTVSNSWHPKGWGEYSPWIRMFQNAYNWTK